MSSTSKIHEQHLKYSLELLLESNVRSQHGVRPCKTICEIENMKANIGYTCCCLHLLGKISEREWILCNLLRTIGDGIRCFSSMIAINISLALSIVMRFAKDKPCIAMLQGTMYFCMAEAILRSAKVTKGPALISCEATAPVMAP